MSGKLLSSDRFVKCRISRSAEKTPASAAGVRQVFGVQENMPLKQPVPAGFLWFETGQHRPFGYWSLLK